ncbi:MAG: hypothetical protein Q9224_003327 [Gallowayella concinna]
MTDFPALAAGSLRSENLSASSFPLMKLPAELRCQIYACVLCREETLFLPTTWYARGPKGCINILRANKQIANEARAILYRHGIFTMEIPCSTRHSIHCETLRSETLSDEFPKLPSTDRVKHWQFDLHFRGLYSEAAETMQPGYTSRHRAEAYQQKYHQDVLSIKEGILEAVTQLAKIEDLQSLTIKFPCRCQPRSTHWQNMHVGFSQIPNVDVTLLISHVLQPLQCLSFKGPVTFIAAQPLLDNDNPLQGPWYQTGITQCQQSACLAFVAHFDKLATFLTGPMPRRDLSSQQHQLLKIKKLIATLYGGDQIEHERDSGTQSKSSRLEREGHARGGPVRRVQQIMQDHRRGTASYLPKTEAPGRPWPRRHRHCSLQELWKHLKSKDQAVPSSRTTIIIPLRHVQYVQQTSSLPAASAYTSKIKQIKSKPYKRGGQSYVKYFISAH